MLAPLLGAFLPGSRSGLPALEVHQHFQLYQHLRRAGRAPRTSSVFRICINRILHDPLITASLLRLVYLIRVSSWFRLMLSCSSSEQLVPLFHRPDGVCLFATQGVVFPWTKFLVLRLFFCAPPLCNEWIP